MNSTASTSTAGTIITTPETVPSPVPSPPKANEQKEEDLEVPCDDEDECYKQLQQDNLLTILGEKVSLVPIDKATESLNVVEFDKYYVPPSFSARDKELLRETMRRLFKNVINLARDVDDEDNFNYTLKSYPPCDQSLKDLVLDSLLYRQQLLRNELSRLGIKSPQELAANLQKGILNPEDPYYKSLKTKTAIYHLVKLYNFINEYDKFQQCIDIDDEMIGKYPQINLTEDQMNELLKQFVFFILQNKNPIQEYTDVEPGAAQVLQGVGKDLLGPRFQAFKKEYEKKYTIPPRIQAVISALELGQLDLQKAFGESQAGDIKVKLVESIKSVLQDPNDPFLKEDFLNKNVEDIFIEILKRLKAYEDEKNKLQKAIEISEKKLKQIEAEKKLVAQKYAAAEQEIKDLEEEQAQGSSISPDLQQEFDDYKKECQDNFDKLNHEYATVVAERDKLIGLKEQQEKIQINFQEQFLKLNTELQQTKIDHAAEKTKLEAQITSLQVQVQTLETNLQEANEAKTKAIQELDTLKQTLAQRETEKGAAEVEVNRLRTELANLQDKFNQLQKDIQTITAQKTEANDKIAELEETIKKLQDDLEESDDKNEELQRTLDALKQEKESYETNVASMTQQINDYKQQVENMKIQLSEGTTKAEQEQARFSALTNEVSALKSEVGRLQVNLNAANEGKQMLEQSYKTQIDEKNNQIADLQKQLSDLQIQHKQELSQKDKDCQEQLKIKDSELNNLRKEISTLETTSNQQLQQLQSQMKEKEDQINNLTASLSDSQKKDGTKQSEITNLQEQLQKLIYEKATLQKNILEEQGKFSTALLEKEAEFKRILGEKDTIIQNMENEAAKNSAKIQSLQQEITTLRTTISQMESNQTIQASELQLQINEKEKEKKALEESMQRMAAKAQQDQAMIEDLNKQITILTQSISSSKTTSETTMKQKEEELARLQQTLAKVESDCLEDKKKLMETQAVLKKLVSEAEVLDKKLQTSQANFNSQIQERNSHLESIVAEKNKRILELEGKVNAQTSELLSRDSRITQLETLLQKQQLKDSEMSKKMEELLQEKRELQDKLDALQKAKKQIEEEKNTLEESFNEERSSLQKEIDKKNNEINKLKETIQMKDNFLREFMDELKILQADQKEKDATILQQQQQLETLRKEYGDLKSSTETSLFRLQDKLKVKEEEVSKIQKQLQVSTQEKNKLQQDLNTKEGEKKKVEAELQQAKQNLQTLETFTSSLQEQMAKLQAEYEKNIRLLEEENKKKDAEINMYQTYFNNNNNQVENMKKALSDNQKEYIIMMEEKENYKREVENYKRQVVNISKNIDEYRQEARIQEAQVKEKDAFIQQLVDAIQTVALWMKQGDVEKRPEVPGSLGQSKYALDAIVSFFQEEKKYHMNAQINQCAFVYLFSYVWTSHFSKEASLSSFSSTGSSSTSRQSRQMSITNMMNDLIKEFSNTNKLVDLLSKIIKFMDENQSGVILSLNDEENRILNKIYASILTQFKNNFNSRIDLATKVENNFMDFSSGSFPFKKFFIELDPSTKRFKTFVRSEMTKSLDNVLQNKQFISYFELFYLYMFAIRDFLNKTHTETGCPLPAILRNQ